MLMVSGIRGKNTNCVELRKENDMSRYVRSFRNKEAIRRYSVYYFKMADSDEHVIKQDTSGSTSTLAQAYRLAAGHCAASELLPKEYAKAMVIDRHRGKVVRIYTKREDKIEFTEWGERK